MSELASALFSIADASEFRFARFYIVCEAVRAEVSTRKSAHCLRRDGHIPRIVKTWPRQNPMSNAVWKKYRDFAQKNDRLGCSETL